jgi:hypothetical protein
MSPPVVKQRLGSAPLAATWGAVAIWNLSTALLITWLNGGDLNSAVLSPCRRSRVSCYHPLFPPKGRGDPSQKDVLYWVALPVPLSGGVTGLSRMRVRAGVTTFLTMYMLYYKTAIYSEQYCHVVRRSPPFDPLPTSANCCISRSSNLIPTIPWVSRWLPAHGLVRILFFPLSCGLGRAGCQPNVPPHLPARPLASGLRTFSLVLTACAFLWATCVRQCLCTELRVPVRCWAAVVCVRALLELLAGLTPFWTSSLRS